jgi:predicted TIM-barrel fold metal-dependent hydrolase
LGSDYPLLPPSRYLKEMDEAGLPVNWRQMVAGKNLAKLMNF